MAGFPCGWRAPISRPAGRRPRPRASCRSWTSRRASRPGPRPRTCSAAARPKPGLPCGASSRSALVGTWTTAPFAPLLRLAAARLGLALTIHETDFGQYFNATLDPRSPLLARGLDVADPRARPARAGDPSLHRNAGGRRRGRGRSLVGSVVGGAPGGGADHHPARLRDAGQRSARPLRHRPRRRAAQRRRRDQPRPRPPGRRAGRGLRQRRDARRSRLGSAYLVRRPRLVHGQDAARARRPAASGPPHRGGAGGAARPVPALRGARPRQHALGRGDRRRRHRGHPARRRHRRRGVRRLPAGAEGTGRPRHRAGGLLQERSRGGACDRSGSTPRWC